MTFRWKTLQEYHRISLYGGRDAYENIQNSNKTVLFTRREWRVGLGNPMSLSYASISSNTQCPPLGLWRNKWQVFCKSSGIDQEWAWIYNEHYIKTMLERINFQLEDRKMHVLKIRVQLEQTVSIYLTDTVAIVKKGTRVVMKIKNWIP